MSSLRLEQILEQRGDETSRSHSARVEWLRMGPARSFTELHKRYLQHNKFTGIEPPTFKYNTLVLWARKYGWHDDAKSYDDEITRLETEVKERKRQEVLSEGLALDYKRVMMLKDLAELLSNELNEKDLNGQLHKLWLPDVKSIGYGEDATIVDIVRFNASLIKELRGILDDIAKEVGGRRQAVDLDVPKAVTLKVYKGISTEDI